MFSATLAHAASDPIADPRFTVGDIRVIGLQRVSEGTVYNYLPVNIGDELTAQRVREALHALHDTGFFRTVELRRDGATLLVVVKERPSIQSFEIKGNKDIKTEELTTSLRGVGLAAGKTFDASVLEDVKAELTDQYFSRGKYGVRIDTVVDELPDNLVRVTIDITEGARAKIRQINIVGNTKFKQKDILETFELTTPKWNNFWKSGTSYSRESLQGDLEKLRSWYMDRGYADFQIESAQVTISPEKDDMFITVAVQEGDVYKIADARVAGNTKVPQAEVERVVQLMVPKGETYSQQAISNAQQWIENRLGLEGYAFAKVDPVPKLDATTKEVTMTFLVEPGQRVYVRRINFEGTTRTQDVVLRREMRQLEGSWVSNVALEASKVRIQRLPYIEEVDYETKRVEGTEDLVDVEFKVKEGPSATLSGGIGYSESSSFILNGSLTDANFFGTGERVALEINAGNYAQVYGFTHTKPFVTIDGVSRTVNASYTRQTQLTSSYSDFSTQTWMAGLDYGWPLSETQSFHLGGSVQRAEFVTSQASSEQLWNWVRNNGGYRYLRLSGATFIRGAISDLFEMSVGWSYEGRNRTLFPTAGTAQSLTLTATVPGSGLQYATATYRFQQFFRVPIPGLRNVPFKISTTAGHGRAYGKTTALPPSRHYFVGGPDSVRGFRDSTLGPRDSLGNPYGGDTAIYGTAEAILPLPRKWQSSARASVFFDYGQSFYLGNTDFRDRNGTLSDTSFDLGRLRASAGVSVEWLGPMGLFRFSYAVPLRWQKQTSRFFGDDRERFQFSVGSAF